MNIARPTRLAVLGDIHGQVDRLTAALDGMQQYAPLDGVLLVGDISYIEWLGHNRDDHVASAGEMIDMVAERGAPVVYVPGNHDVPDLPFPTNTDCRVTDVAGVKVFGIGGTPEAILEDGELREAGWQPLLAAAVDANILLCHAPPKDTPLDAVGKSRHYVYHRGSNVVRAFAERHRGVLFCGHVHEAFGATMLGECLCVNVGSLIDPYGAAMFGILELSPGQPEAVTLLDLDRQTRHRWIRQFP